MPPTPTSPRRRPTAHRRTDCPPSLARIAVNVRRTARRSPLLLRHHGHRHHHIVRVPLEVTRRPLNPHRDRPRLRRQHHPPQPDHQPQHCPTQPPRRLPLMRQNRRSVHQDALNGTASHNVSTSRAANTKTYTPRIIPATASPSLIGKNPFSQL